MPSIPGSYKEILSINKDSSDSAKKILKSVFLLGPSKAVMSNGQVIVSEAKVAQDQEDNQQASSENNQPSNDNENSSNSETTQSSDKSPNESFHYSIIEAASYLLGPDSYLFYEKSKKKKKNKNNSLADKLRQAVSNTPSANSDQSAQQGSDQIPQQEEVINKDSLELDFNQDTDLDVIVDLPNEGCTRWHVRLKNVTDRTKIINALKSKKFRAAYDMANSQAAQSLQNSQNENGQPSEPKSAEGLVVISATVMLDSKALAPFIGRCKWAFDVGSDTSNEEAFELEIAIAPIDGKTRKPNTDTVFHTVFDINGDITGGQLSGFTNFNKAKDFVMGNDNSDKENDPSAMLSEWLHKNFKSPGDSSMYKEFLKVRKFVQENLNKNVEEDPGKKTLELNEKESTFIADYAKIIQSKKSFISF